MAVVHYYALKYHDGRTRNAVLELTGHAALRRAFMCVQLAQEAVKRELKEHLL